MQNLRYALGCAVGAFAIYGVLALGNSTRDAHAAPNGCRQWQTSVWTPQKPFDVPAGWEPIGVGPAIYGGFSYGGRDSPPILLRRCK